MRVFLRGHIEVVQLLIVESAWVHVKTNEGWTALMIAYNRSEDEVVRLLKEAGAKDEIPKG